MTEGDIFLNVGKGKCVVCDREHDNCGEDFPDNFPEEWKICCFCLTIASQLSSISLEEIISWATNMANKGISSFPSLHKWIEKVKKVDKLINVG